MMYLFMVLALLIAVAGIAFRMVQWKRRTARYVHMLNEGDPAEGFAYGETLLEKSRKGSRIHRMMEINQAAALTLLSRWDEAEARLRDVRVGHLPRVFRVIHANNLLYVLLLQGKTDEAREVREANDSLLQHGSRYLSVQQAVRSTLAIYEFYLGDVEKARATLYDLMGEMRPRNQHAQFLYFLGRAEHRLGNVVNAKAHLDKAVELGQDTFIPDAVAYFWEHQAENEAPVS